MIRRTHRKLDRRTPRRGGRNEAPFLPGRIRALEEFVFCERGNERLKGMGCNGYQCKFSEGARSIYITNGLLILIKKYFSDILK